MKIYLVGGAVRDHLLGLPTLERDWVVVGATPQTLLDQGFKPVGKEFPVFLHPHSQEEYALARRERKTGVGYTGFDCVADPNISLEEDLLRRDLTINAIAQDEHGILIDPYGGQRDLAAKKLRHVSDAFIEDPLRVLRVARFAARFHHLGFRVADETLALMKKIAHSGELAHLTPERVWKEIELALSTKTPSAFFEVLRLCDALRILLPEIEQLFGVPQPAQYHPEIDTGVHTMLVIDACATRNFDAPTVFAALTHDLGKGTTPPHEWPRHIGHEERSVQLIQVLCERLRCPRDYKELAISVARFHTHCHKALELRPNTLVDLFEKLDAFRRPERFLKIIAACEADFYGRPGFEHQVYEPAQYLKQSFDAIKNINTSALQESTLSGAAFGIALRQQRIDILKSLKASYDAQ